MPSALPVQYGMLWMMEFTPALNPDSEAPLYRQLYERIAEKIRSALAAPYNLNGNAVDTTPSIGVALYPQHGSDADTLFK